VLDAAARTGRADDETAPVDTLRTIAGHVFRAPTSGRYYGRPTPDKPAFLTVGAELRAGATVCLLEVMKTFNRVTYSGEPARVRELLVADGADVNAGDPLLALELNT
jgi:acetyl-CoA carboxylase biotin carboxyl carrier protein